MLDVPAGPAACILGAADDKNKCLTMPRVEAMLPGEPKDEGKGAGQMIGKHRVIALEEHYADDLTAIEGQALINKLSDVHDIRLPEMDAAGVDVQILSAAPPGMQRPDASADLALQANNRLALLTQEAPDRLMAFAALPTASPSACADELRRAVGDLGFRGALINGTTGGGFLDDPAYLDMFRAAQDLGVPIYLHPGQVVDAVSRAYLAPYDTSHPMFAHAAWGFTIDTGTHAMRLVLSGLFDACPDVQIILGHLGEGIPYLMPRIEEALSRNTPMKNFSEVFTRHFHVTSSGFFSNRSLQLCIDVMGIDRVMFSVDWPYASNSAATDWASHLDLGDDGMSRFLHRNAEALLRL
ncbi:amidohydrolase family protein [Pseudooceanicola pacificus]|nr:amidohydrolase family protein [Pseudooceanicola pacificus]